MTKEELRKHPEYERCMNKITNYKSGFEFTLPVATIPKAKWNALKIILKDAADANLIESISFGLDINGNIVEETYRRI